MSKKKEQLPFERRSYFNENRDSYADAHGNYAYTRWEQLSNGRWERRTAATIPFSEESRDIIIYLDQSDHDEDLSDRYAEENADYSFRNRQEGCHRKADDDSDFDSSPMDAIPDSSPDVFDLLFPEGKPRNADVERVAEFIRTELTEEQKNLLYAHLGMGLFLEDVRREEEAATGKKITKQAMHNRWDRILSKACKYFGVEKPKQEHKTSK